MKEGFINIEFQQEILEIFPAEIFIVDDDVRILYANKTAQERLLPDKERFIKVKGGDALKCINSLIQPEGCGKSEACKSCVIRNSVNLAYAGKETRRKETVFNKGKNGDILELELLITTAPFALSGKTYAILIIEDISEIFAMRKLIPICASCKRIRKDSNYWESVEIFLREHTDMEFSHGICPDCMKKLYPEYVK
jgi:PAS domain-containing protein